MAGPEEAWQDFGQRVDLTARIREILLNYPEGSTILKELVQVHGLGAAVGCRPSGPCKHEGEDSSWVLQRSLHSAPGG